MALTAYTSYADVRAALGVTPKELSDDTLALPLYENVLVLAFGKQDAGFQAFLDTTLAVVGPSALQSYFLRLAQVFATYTVAQAAARIEAGADAQLVAAQAKLFATRTAERQLPVLAQAMGAEGLRDSHPFGRHLAGARVASFVDGSSEMLLERIAALQRQAIAENPEE